MSDIHYYETTIDWNEERIGTISSEGMECVTVATPPEFPKGVPNIWSPEHLFVASVNTCLMTTFLAVAENSKLNFVSYKSCAKGKLEKVDGKFKISEIELCPEIVVSEEKDLERAGRIIEKSEKACLISNSINSAIILRPEIKVKMS